MAVVRRLFHIIRSAHQLYISPVETLRVGVSSNEPIRVTKVRIGHMGYTTEAEIQHVLDALASALPAAGFTAVGAGTAK